jgi:hypothetical protein
VDTAGVLLASGWWHGLDEVWAEVMKVMERSSASIASWRVEEAWPEQVRAMASFKCSQSHQFAVK